MDVDVLTGDLTKLPGSIGLMSAPGQARQLVADLDDLANRQGCLVLVSLVSNHEFNLLGLNDLPERCAERGMRLIRFPIADFSTPISVESVMALAAEILGAMSDRGMVAIHCRAGLGRTGLVAACCLVACGMSSIEAIEVVRRCRPGTIENGEQEKFVERFAEVVAVSKRRLDPKTSR